MAYPRRTSEAPPEQTSIERVEAWTTSQAADLSAVLSATAISSPSPRPPRGTGVTLDIPLDSDEAVVIPSTNAPAPRPRAEAVHTVYKRRAPIRRDSLARREALLKGKEGSRQRRRWENDRLIGNPHAAPPLPSDWQVQPTYRAHRVPYVLLPLWDAEYARAAQDRQRRAEAERAKTGSDASAARVRQELRTKLKRAKGAKGLLHDLEEDVRAFLSAWFAREEEEEAVQLRDEGAIESDTEGDSEDEEIVFVGRDGTSSAAERRREQQQQQQQQKTRLQQDRLIFQGSQDDDGAAFARYLVHAIATYYGLRTWSVTSGDPAQRCAYVGVHVDLTTRRPSLTRSEMPQPLYAVV